MIRESLFALVVIFNQSPTEWQEVAYAESISFEQCDAAQRAIWDTLHGEIVGYDHSGALYEIDAYCVDMLHFQSPEFSNVIR